MWTPPLDRQWLSSWQRQESKHRGEIGEMATVYNVSEFITSVHALSITIHAASRSQASVDTVSPMVGISTDCAIAFSVTANVQCNPAVVKSLYDSALLIPDPQYLVSGEDLEGPDDDAMANESGPTPYPLPIVRQVTSHPRDVIFVERKGTQIIIT